ncbi:hypothetical protein B0H15DRAFT_157309 [Mycena belliarum]|uniref:Uncharacterized protein n=1 Tax=Mycena belliarum TaxID=1033014 RepID=A0AAD6U8S7_9AGAR|nr:hypothetical protein B0H15DRAFT_157309 [Mycena belliae]
MAGRRQSFSQDAGCGRYTRIKLKYSVSLALFRSSDRGTTGTQKGGARKRNLAPCVAPRRVRDPRPSHTVHPARSALELLSAERPRQSSPRGEAVHRRLWRRGRTEGTSRVADPWGDENSTDASSLPPSPSGTPRALSSRKIYHHTRRCRCTGPAVHLVVPPSVAPRSRRRCTPGQRRCMPRRSWESMRMCRGVAVWAASVGLRGGDAMELHTCSLVAMPRECPDVAGSCICSVSRGHPPLSIRPGGSGALVHRLLSPMASLNDLPAMVWRANADASGQTYCVAVHTAQVSGEHSRSV